MAGTRSWQAARYACRPLDAILATHFCTNISAQARGIRAANIPTKARLTYFQDEMLKLELQYKSEEEWTPCFELGAVVLPPVCYLGFSAETGELSDNFDILRLDMYNLYSSAPSRSEAGGKTAEVNKQQTPVKKPSSRSSNSGKQEGSGWGWTLVKLLLFVAVCGGGYVGWTVYRASKRSRFD